MITNDDDPGKHSCHRVFEWVQAFGIMDFGIHLFIFPETLEVSRFAPIMNFFNIWQLAAIFTIIGASRIVVLYLNGKIGTHGPILRAILSALSMAIMIQLVLALAASRSPGLHFYLSWACGEFRTIWRAKRDFNGLRFHQ